MITSARNVIAAAHRRGLPFALARHETAAVIMAATTAELTGELRDDYRTAVATLVERPLPTWSNPPTLTHRRQVPRRRAHNSKTIKPYFLFKSVWIIVGNITLSAKSGVIDKHINL